MSIETQLKQLRNANKTLADVIGKAYEAWDESTRQLTFGDMKAEMTFKDSKKIVDSALSKHREIHSDGKPVTQHLEGIVNKDTQRIEWENGSKVEFDSKGQDLEEAIKSVPQGAMNLDAGTKKIQDINKSDELETARRRKALAEYLNIEEKDIKNDPERDYPDQFLIDFYQGSDVHCEVATSEWVCENEKELYMDGDSYDIMGQLRDYQSGRVGAYKQIGPTYWLRWL
tara:strand:+ start:517 stop:1200 length:684 start_codon:yes stop_codon:yes gene_type:complete